MIDGEMKKCFLLSDDEAECGSAETLVAIYVPRHSGKADQKHTKLSHNTKGKVFVMNSFKSKIHHYVLQCCAI